MPNKWMENRILATSGWCLVCGQGWWRGEKEPIAEHSADNIETPSLRRSGSLALPAAAVTVPSHRPYAWGPGLVAG